MTKFSLALSSAVFLVAGCADGNHRPYTLDQNFGKSQAQVVQAQIADPQAAKNPPPDTARRLDGYAGVNIINSYRNGFSQTHGAQSPSVNINVGSATGSNN